MAIDPHISQLANAVTLACSQQVIPSGFLEKWQTLIGAAVGGLLGVAGAMIVASNTTRRERRVAALMVLPEVMSLTAANQGIENILSTSTGWKKAESMCANLLKKRPSITALHSSVVYQLSDADARLYSHLQLCRMHHAAFEAALDSFKEAANNARAPVSGPNDIDSALTWLKMRAADVIREWKGCVEHATLANYFLDRLIFRWPAWAHRLRMRFRPNDLDSRSNVLLKTGGLPVTTSDVRQSSIDESTSI